MNHYLIPANSKKSLMFFGMFTLGDLILFGVGATISMILLFALNINSLLFAILAITPGVICAFLILPIPNYHNVRTIIRLAWNFYTTRQKYIWRGWCYKDGEERDKE